MKNYTTFAEFQDDLNDALDNIRAVAGDTSRAEITLEYGESFKNPPANDWTIKLWTGEEWVNGEKGEDLATLLARMKPAHIARLREKAAKLRGDADKLEAALKTLETV